MTDNTKARELVAKLRNWPANDQTDALAAHVVADMLAEAADLIEALASPTEDEALERARVFMGRDDDCFQAAIATLLGLPLNAVPRFDEEAIPGKNQNSVARKWLKERGFEMDVHLAEMRRVVSGFHIACGTSPRGCGHAVVYHDDQLFHDPHPEGGGLVGEPDEIIIIRPTLPTLHAPERC